MEFQRFEHSLKMRRRLRCYDFGDYLRRIPVGLVLDDNVVPPELVEDLGVEGAIFETSSFASRLGEGASRLESVLQNQIPVSIRSFYEQFSEALLVTRSFPIHIWTIDKVLDRMNDMRQKRPYPLRFFRFADYWDLNEAEFALWQPNPKNPQWIVVSTSVNEIDDQYDVIGQRDYYKVGDSFNGWLDDLIARDGLPDPFIELDQEGGFLDPA